MVSVRDWIGIKTEMRFNFLNENHPCNTLEGIKTGRILPLILVARQLISRYAGTVVLVLLLFIPCAGFAATVTYTYDSKGQLIKEDYGSGTFLEYSYDAAGNRTAVRTSLYRLTVDSANPDSGMFMTVIPADYNGGDSGTTSFQRLYKSGTVVTVTAPATSGWFNFGNWTGCDSVNGTECTLTMSGPRMVTANYLLPSSVLTVNSSNPVSGAEITVVPTDNSGQGNGSTLFTRTYGLGTVVVLTANGTAGGNVFSSWAGCDSVSGLQCTVAITGAKSVTAYYQPRTWQLSVNSFNPASGVAVTVSPLDNNSQASGSTKFMRTYNPSTPVTLTAPATAGGNPFASWIGCDFANGTQCSVTMNSIKSVMAMYSNLLNYSSTDIPKTIPDFSLATGAGSVSSTLTVPSGICTGGIGVLNVWIKANHTYVNDLRFVLKDNPGTSVTVIDPMPVPPFPPKQGCAGDNIDVVLDDQAAVSMNSHPCNPSTPAINGTYSPSDPLSRFNGTDPAGTWTLTATDNAMSDTGTLTGWGLNIGCLSSLPNYSVTLTKAGKGTVSSSPSGLSCAVSDKTCSGAFPLNSVVSLTASNSDTCPVTYSWSGACSGYSNQCDFVMTGNSNVALEMNIVSRQVKNQQTQATGASIQAAYVNASSGNVLRSQTGIFSENLTVSKSLTLEGGYDCSFGSRTGITAVKGSLTISGGSLIVDGVALQ